jgi:CheY-like chemotaxis protein
MQAIARAPACVYNTIMNIPYGPILVVEDLANVRELLEVALRFKGYPVVTAENGREALNKIERQHPSLVITDILMPRMDGFTLAHQMRKDQHTTSIPIIFVSATYITAEDKKFAHSLGGVRFVEKPIDTEDFLLTVAEVLTGGAPSIPRPLKDEEFYSGYRDRLESKLRYKNTQIARTERLLKSLPEEQKPAFEALLADGVRDRDEIQDELQQLMEILSQLNPGNLPAGQP